MESGWKVLLLLSLPLLTIFAAAALLFQLVDFFEEIGGPDFREGVAGDAVELGGAGKGLEGDGGGLEVLQHQAPATPDILKCLIAARFAEGEIVSHFFN